MQAQLAREERRIKAKHESDHRILDSARSSLDAQQLAVMQEYMAEYIERATTDLQMRRARVEQACSGKCVPGTTGKRGSTG
ncbi:MAG: hypothetical protein ABI645_05125 [Pseudomonadota bacterium]